MELDRVIAETRQRFSNVIYQKLKFCETSKAEFKKSQVIIIPDLNNKDAVIVNIRKKRQESQ